MPLVLRGVVIPFRVDVHGRVEEEEEEVGEVMGCHQLQPPTLHQQQHQVVPLILEEGEEAVEQHLIHLHKEVCVVVIPG